MNLPIFGYVLLPGAKRDSKNPATGSTMHIPPTIPPAPWGTRSTRLQPQGRTSTHQGLGSHLRTWLKAIQSILLQQDYALISSWGSANKEITNASY